jgi:hypothetical protein
MVFVWEILLVSLAVKLQVLNVYTVIWFRFLFACQLLAVYLGVQHKLPSLEKLHSTSGKLLAIATFFWRLTIFWLCKVDHSHHLLMLK